jgi:hypothetical protein
MPVDRQSRPLLLVLIATLTVLGCSSTPPDQQAREAAVEAVVAGPALASSALQPILRNPGLTAEDALREGGYAVEEVTGWADVIGSSVVILDRRITPDGQVSYDVLFFAKHTVSVPLSSGHSSARMCVQLLGPISRNAVVKIRPLTCPVNAEQQADVEVDYERPTR